MMARGMRMDPSITKQKVKPGTVKRIARYARPYRVQLAIFLFCTALDACITVVNPLLLRELIDNGIIKRDQLVVLVVALTAVAVALFDALPRRGEPLLLLPARRGHHLRPAHPGLRPRAAPAARVLHPRADRVAGQPPRRRRGGRAAGDRGHPVVGRVQRAVGDRAPGHHVLPVLGDQPGGAGADPAVHDPGADGRQAAAAPEPRVDAAQRRDGHHDDRAVQRGRRDARQALRPAAAGVGAVRVQGAQSPRDRRHAGTCTGRSS